VSIKAKRRVSDQMFISQKEEWPCGPALTFDGFKIKIKIKNNANLKENCLEKRYTLVK